MTDPSPATEVRAFFEQYNEAFATFDGKQVAALYYMPTVTMRGDGSIHCLRSQDDLAAFFQGVIDTYRTDGYTGSSLKNLEVLPLGDLSVLATMDWEIAAAGWKPHQKVAPVVQRRSHTCGLEDPCINLPRRQGGRLTLRSRRGPTAGHQARAGGTRYIFTGPGLASCR